MGRDAVVAFVADPEVSHTAWRCTRPLAALERVGVPTQVVTLPGPSLDGWVYSPAYEGVTFGPEVATLLLHRAIVPVQFRESFAEWIGKVKASGVTVVYDTDDDVYSPAWAEHHVDMQFGPLPIVNEAFDWAAVSEVRKARRAESAALAWILDQVDGITVSTAHLAGVVGQYTQTPVFVVPNAIDVDAFKSGLRDRAFGPWADEAGVVTIGWCAGSRPEADAEPVAEAWRRIAARYPSARFSLAGHPQRCLVESVPSDRLAVYPYQPMSEYPWAMQVDIGCCSAAPTLFNKSRSPIKAWEFALAGAAVVASLTVYEDAIDGGKDGWLAERAVAWESTIANLIDFPATRTAMATNLREKVERYHALDKSLWRWTDSWKAIRKVSAPA